MYTFPTFKYLLRTWGFLLRVWYQGGLQGLIHAVHKCYYWTTPPGLASSAHTLKLDYTPSLSIPEALMAVRYSTWIYHLLIRPFPIGSTAQLPLFTVLPYHCERTCRQTFKTGWLRVWTVREAVRVQMTTLWPTLDLQQVQLTQPQSPLWTGVRGGYSTCHMSHYEE